MKTSVGEKEMELLLRANGIPFKREYRFHNVRKWRFDFALTDWWIAIEVEGGIFTKGRHTRGSGFTSDLLKYNAAVTLGWLVLRYTTAQVNANVISDINKVKERRLYERGRLQSLPDPKGSIPNGQMSSGMGKGNR